MRGRLPRSWFLWLLGFWLSIATPLAAWGCLQACAVALPEGGCCASEIRLPCSDHPCSCEPCPVCGTPAPLLLSASTKSDSPAVYFPVLLEPALELCCLVFSPPNLPSPLLPLLEALALDAHGVRAPPALS